MKHNFINIVLVTESSPKAHITRRTSSWQLLACNLIIHCMLRIIKIKFLSLNRAFWNLPSSLTNKCTIY